MRISDVKVLHLQYTNWQRMLSKQRWYQVWERLNYPRKRAIQIFRQYHHMTGWPDNEIYPVRPEWMNAYHTGGIDLTRSNSELVTWWDRQIVDLLTRHGPARFRKLAIWDTDWREVAALSGRTDARDTLRDPRGLLDRAIHRWLSATQPRMSCFRTRLVQQALRVAGW